MSIAVRDFSGPNLLGVDASRALAVLLSSFRDVEEVYLAECRPLPSLQTRRHLNATERIVFERALEYRKSTGLAFWDAVLLELCVTPEAIPLLDEVSKHVTFRGKERSLSWASAVSNGLEQACAQFTATADESLVFLSEMRCRDGSKRHLPMIDFHAARSVPNERVVTAVAKRLFPEGAILLESGESYHAYSTKLVSETDFRCFLGRALLFAPIVDRTYIAHQLIEGRCALRLTAGGTKSRVPTVVALIPGS
jgi:hypothetical protein